MQFASFPSIGGLHNVVATHGARPDIFPETQIYRAKIKLHGTNMGVRITESGPIAQGRGQDLNLNDHGYWFLDYVTMNRAYFTSLWQGRDFVVFGEWAGPGIQKKTAVSKIPEKMFAVFMVQDGPSDGEETECIYDPDRIAEFVTGTLPDRLHILPWEGEPLVITWNDRASVEQAAEQASTAVLAVEGIGEGLVYYPLGVTKRNWIGAHIFKAKGLKHKVIKTDKVIDIDPAVAESIDEFVEMFVTRPRLEQGLEMTGDVTPDNIGPFLAWMGHDIEKESVDELAASNLKWKQVVKASMRRAREWYFEQMGR